MISIERPIRFIMFLLTLILIVAVAAFIVFFRNTNVAKSGDFTIEPGQSAAATWEKLADDDFTGRTLPWRYQAWRQQAASQIKAGVYQLEVGEKASDVIARFIAGDTSPAELNITYPEGFTLEQIAERTAGKGIGTKEEFINSAKPADFADTYPYLAELEDDRTLEGYLFPDTYRVFPDDTPHDVITRMLGNFDKKLTSDIRAQAAASGRTIDQIVNMASIVEREVISDADMALVAGVLWSRFDDGVGLGADATVRYALDKPTGPLSVQDLDVDSPYNTRKYRGLPPGPVSNPGLRALMASAFPEESDYYYYLSATDTGETIFSKTLEEHNANKAKHL